VKADIPGFTVTPELLDQAKREKDRLEQDIVEAQHKLALINQFLRLAEAYSDEPKPGTEVEAPEETEESEEPEESESVDPSNMMGLISQIANESAKPITKAEMKVKLVAAGMPKGRLGSYFYVAVDRLKKKDRITVLEDGRIWRAPKN
jgi:hypothetical protein